MASCKPRWEMVRIGCSVTSPIMWSSFATVTSTTVLHTRRGRLFDRKTWCSVVKAGIQQKPQGQLPFCKREKGQPKNTCSQDLEAESKKLGNSWQELDKMALARAKGSGKLLWIVYIPGWTKDNVLHHFTYTMQWGYIKPTLLPCYMLCIEPVAWEWSHTNMWCEALVMQT